MSDTDKQVFAWKDQGGDKHMVEIMMWYSCNANCLFCSNDPYRRRMDKDTVRIRTGEILRQILDARDEGYRILGLTGGEPTIYPDILKILRFARQMDFKTVRVQTNAMMLSDPGFSKRLIDAGATFIKFSIHGHNALLHDLMTQVPGSYDMVMKAFDNLEEMEVATEVNFLINRLNYRFLPQFIASMFNHGKSRFVIIFPMYEGKMRLAADKIGVRLSEAAPYVREAIDLVKILGLEKIILMNIPLCFMTGYEEYTSERRTFDITVSTPDGTETVGQNMVDSKVQGPACAECVYRQECLGLWRDYADIYGFEELTPVRIRSDKVR